MLPEEVLDVVRELNDEIDNKLENAEATFHFSMESDGYCSLVTFMGLNVWSSEDDERDFIDEKDEYEPLKDYIKRETSKLVRIAVCHAKIMKQIKKRN